MIHASADFELLSLVRIHSRAIEQGVAALQSGARVITDTEMARSGITARRIQELGASVQCCLNDPGVREEAREKKMTRSALAVERACQVQGRSIFVIGNAPTALFRLLELIRENRAEPDLVVGMPVGFVGAAESKEHLMRQDRVPWITIRGRKGGSPLAAACLNSLAELALSQSPPVRNEMDEQGRDERESHLGRKME
jgi:precorrin-8X/cobalt-precorrin-8 methylmutase